MFRCLSGPFRCQKIPTLIYKTYTSQNICNTLYKFVVIGRYNLKTIHTYIYIDESITLMLGIFWKLKTNLCSLPRYKQIKQILRNLNANYTWKFMRLYQSILFIKNRCIYSRYFFLLECVFVLDCIQILYVFINN